MEIFDIHINNETELGWTFDENLVNFDQPDDIEKIIDNIQTIKSTETLSYKSFSSICNKLYSVMKNNNKISTFVIGVLLEMKEVIISKKIHVDLNWTITYFRNFKNTFTPLEKENHLILIEPLSSSIQENVKKKKSNHEPGKFIKKIFGIA